MAKVTVTIEFHVDVEDLGAAKSKLPMGCIALMHKKLRLLVLILKECDGQYCY
jgi:hypothetical protein